MPLSSHAAVLINEVAWMGTEVSVSDEWIELYNSGEEAIHLDGWSLIDNVSLEIGLTGTLESGAFAVLERTDDASAPGAAFLIYAGALSNDGRTLILKRSNDTIEDQVAGGESWENIGGDNITKDTAQRTTFGWITAPPTPGEVNETVTAVIEEREDSAEEDRNTAPNESVSLVIPQNELQLSITAPDIAYVHQEVPFKVESRGIGESLMDSLTYDWNFGDTYTKSGKTVSHMFGYPGTYIVVVEGMYARHDSVVRHEITVLPVTLSISRAV